jgi:hypothetical protein
MDRNKRFVASQKKKEINGLFWFLFEGFTSIRPLPLICLEYFI